MESVQEKQMHNNELAQNRDIAPPSDMTLSAGSLDLFACTEMGKKPQEKTEDAVNRRVNLTPSDAQTIKDTIKTTVKDEVIRQELLENLDHFSKRAKNDALPSQEYGNTVQEIQKLLKSNYGVVDLNNRILAAHGIMANAAFPDRVRQGPHPTCAVATIEHILYTKCPATVANMVSSAACDGKWLSKQNKEIALPQESLMPGYYEKKFPSDNRSYASQLAQIVLLNDMGQNSVPPIKYLQSKKLFQWGWNSDMLCEEDYWLFTDGTQRDFGDPGEGILSKSGGPRAIAASDELFRVTGQRNGAIENKHFDPDDPIPGNCRPAEIADENLLDVRTSLDLMTALQNLKTNCKLPIIAIVDDTAIQQAFTGSAESMEPEALNHAVTVDDYAAQEQGQPAMVLIHNQKSPKLNGWISVETLAKTMLLKN